jgi:hypothetical protein
VFSLRYKLNSFILSDDLRLQMVKYTFSTAQIWNSVRGIKVYVVYLS